MIQAMKSSYIGSTPVSVVPKNYGRAVAPTLYLLALKENLP
jgi:hypothetical protein